MSVQVTQGNFAESAPPTGSIKVLYKDQNGVSNIRAVTISNVDLDGNNVRLSLDAIEQLRVFLGGQTPLTREQLNVITRASKPRDNGRDYFYLDVEDLFLSNGQQISGSDSSFINITPYLPQPFFNNDYNALISNADTVRTSNNKYDVDRAGGVVLPTNYEAIAGIGEMTHTDLLYEDKGGLKTKEDTTRIWVSVNNLFLSESVTSPTSVIDDRDTTVRVDKSSIINAIGVPAKSFTSIPDEFRESSAYDFEFRTKLNIEIDQNDLFNNAGAKFQSASLATQINKNGQITTEITPFETTITSGSYNGEIFVRLTQTAELVSSNGFTTGTTYISQSSMLRAGNNLSNTLPVRLYYPTQEPYAPLAPVQESNYTHTGHTNARYDGTKTTELDFSGLSPSIAVKPLDAAIYDTSVTSSYICSQSLDDRTIEEIFYEGESEFPTVGIETVAYLNDPISNQTQTEIIVQGIPGIKISAGDILELFVEKILVLSVQQTFFPSGLPKFTLQVQRSYESTVPQPSYSPGTIIRRISGARLYRFNKNRPVAIGNRRVWIKETRTIVETNDRGFVTAVVIECEV